MNVLSNCNINEPQNISDSDAFQVSVTKFMLINEVFLMDEGTIIHTLQKF